MKKNFIFRIKHGLFLLAILMVLPLTVSARNLIMARAADATGLDPHTQTAFASLRLLELIYEPLVILDEKLNIVPALAESWSFSSDGKVLTFKLRKGVTFHDGSKMTAKDVIASFNRILTEKTGAATRANFLSIQSIEEQGQNTVVFYLSRPDVPILTAMTDTNASIISSDIISNGNPSQKAIGTGPFVLNSWSPDEKTMLKANKKWWGSGPFVDGIEIRILPDESSILAALRAGKIDFALINDPLVATMLKGSSKIKLNRATAISYHVLQLNSSRTPLNKLEVRQAISCAIDRQEVLDTASLGEGQVTGPLTIPAYQLSPGEYFCYKKDVEFSKKLLKNAGWSSGVKLKAIVANAEPPTALSEAQNIQAQLAKVGIEMEIESLELNVYIQRWLKADFDMAVAHNSGRADPYTMYNRYWTKKGNLQKVSKYIDDKLDRLMAEGRVETEPKRRKRIFADFQKHLVKQAPWIWLYTGFEYTAQQSYVTGFVPMSNDSLYFLHQVRLSK